MLREYRVFQFSLNLFSTKRLIIGGINASTCRDIGKLLREIVTHGIAIRYRIQLLRMPIRPTCLFPPDRPFILRATDAQLTRKSAWNMALEFLMVGSNIYSILFHHMSYV